MNTSAIGIALIKGFEKCRLEAFKPTPDDVWTIGWGHTSGVHEGDTCTHEEADAWLVEDLRLSESCVTKMVRGELTQGEFDALVSFTYNLGCTALRNSTLLRHLNAGAYDAAAEEFGKWTHQHGKELAGLVTRRAAERRMFEATV